MIIYKLYEGNQHKYSVCCDGQSQESGIQVLLVTPHLN